MRIILAPAKKMRIDDGLSPQGRPLFPAETKEILAWLRTRTPAQLQTLWKCSAKLAEQNIARLAVMRAAAAGRGNTVPAGDAGGSGCGRQREPLCLLGP